jgi:hypothetical protein
MSSGDAVNWHEPRQPVPPRASEYGIDPSLVSMRAAELPDMCSLDVSELFPSMPRPLYLPSEGVQSIRDAVNERLESVDMSQIRRRDSVNILASHHGFTLFGGEPYAELLRAVRDVIRDRTGTDDIRLRAGVGLRFRETEEYIRQYGLDDYFEGKAIGISPIDEGVAIDTSIGTLYGLKKAYDARWIVHAHHSDVREVHFHRQVDKALKPFGMSYARIETRSTYHQNLGPRAANFVARAIFESEFVQRKFAFAAFLNAAPNGIYGVDADNDLYALNDRVTIRGCRHYGKVMTLLGRIDDCVAVLDFPCPVPYVFAAGVIYANFTGANIDLYDLDNAFPPYTWYTEAFYDKQGRPLLPEIPKINPAIKACVHNYAWTGYPSAFFAQQIPTLVVGEAQAELFRRDPQNTTYMDAAKVVADLEGAMRTALDRSDSGHAILFDGAIGSINLSRDLAPELVRAAHEVDREVDEVLLPKWLAQRGITQEIPV